MIYNYAYYFIQIERHSRRESGVKDIKARINRNVVRNSEKYVKDWFQAPILPESAPLETVGFLRRAATVTIYRLLLSGEAAVFVREHRAMSSVFWLGDKEKTRQTNTEAGLVNKRILLASKYEEIEYISYLFNIPTSPLTENNLRNVTQRDVPL